MSAEAVIEKVDCLTKRCKNSNHIEREYLLVSPFEVDDNDLRILFSYFLHRAPGINSVKAEKIDSEKHAALLKEMIDGTNFKYYKFCAPNVKIEGEFSKGYIDGDKLCLKCKRFVCKIAGEKPKETDLVCFLRHIRNAIAHSRVYYQHIGNGTRIMFEDKNKQGNYTARIICTKSDLKRWRKILNRKINYQ